tara:strand:+ start:386 stop:634 length:249 start_codon:yes stop_codon:yes gene_type:complete
MAPSRQVPCGPSYLSPDCSDLAAAIRQAFKSAEMVVVSAGTHYLDPKGISDSSTRAHFANQQFWPGQSRYDVNGVITAMHTN